MPPVSNEFVRKGHIVILDGSLAGTAFRFPINPAQIKDSKTVNYKDHNILHRSHPKTHFNFGGPRQISFKLDLDIKSESFVRSNVGVTSIAKMQSLSPKNTEPLPDAAYGRRTDLVFRLVQSIRFLQAFMYPRSFEGVSLFGQDVQGGPPPVQFVYGDHMILRCIVKKADVTYLEMNSNLDPLRVTVGILLQEKPSRTKSFFDHLISGDTVETLK